jgi:hypothetical protein
MAARREYFAHSPCGFDDLFDEIIRFSDAGFFAGLSSTGLMAGLAQPVRANIRANQAVDHRAGGHYFCAVIVGLQPRFPSSRQDLPR